MKKLYVWLIALIIILYGTGQALSAAVPRVVIGLYDGEQHHNTILYTYLHTLAEMPLNHMGVNIEYHDVSQGVPEIKNREDVIGVITWFDSETKLKDPEAYLEWAHQVIDAGKKFVIFGNPAFYVGKNDRMVPSYKVSNFLNRFGLTMPTGWKEYGWDSTLEVLSPKFIKSLDKLDHIPSYPQMKLNDNRAIVHLQAREKDGHNWPLIVTHPNGGVVSEGFSFTETSFDDEMVNQWIIDPFAFFEYVFAIHDLPKPDTTTLAGRRIYYSHIDGDGWNNITQCNPSPETFKLSSEIILEKAIRPYPDLPVSLTLIAADIDPHWVGTERSRQVAKEFFKEPQVEAGSHTYSHPFYWEFFEDGKIEKEIPYLKYYYAGHWEEKNMWEWLATLWPLKHTTHSHEGNQSSSASKDLPNDYQTPRAFANYPFDLNTEIKGSLETIAQLLPKDKEMRLITWSGNTSPFPEALRLTQEANVANINGGDGRFDPEYPDYASIMPIGRQVGPYRQIYTSMSNENTYTNLWTGRFHGYRYLKKTLQNTEYPRRLKPMNIYYHLYAGEKCASLAALTEMLDYAHSKPITPIPASDFSRIAEGFYTTQFEQLDNDKWRVLNRGALQTVRFDDVLELKVDFSASEGIIGQRYYRDSLYVYLDASTEKPVIALTKRNSKDHTPWLVESRWLISNIKRNGANFTFNTHGFGQGEMRWNVPSNGPYTIQLSNNQIIQAEAKDSILTFELPDTASSTMISVRKGSI